MIETSFPLGDSSFGGDVAYATEEVPSPAEEKVGFLPSCPAKRSIEGPLY